jgi:hypothetical protein
MNAPLRCRLFGHKHPLGAQVFAKVEQREAEGTWLAVYGWCSRCNARPLLGSLWMQDYTVKHRLAPPQA